MGILKNTYAGDVFYESWWISLWTESRQCPDISLKLAFTGRKYEQ